MHFVVNNRKTETSSSVVSLKQLSFRYLGNLLFLLLSFRTLSVVERGRNLLLVVAIAYSSSSIKSHVTLSDPRSPREGSFS